MYSCINSAKIQTWEPLKRPYLSGYGCSSRKRSSILPFLPVCAVFSRVQTMVWLPDVDACDCSPGAVSNTVSECVPKVDSGREGETDRQTERACSTEESNPRQYAPASFFLSFFFFFFLSIRHYNLSCPGRSLALYQLVCTAPWENEIEAHAVETVFVFRADSHQLVWHVDWNVWGVTLKACVAVCLKCMRSYTESLCGRLIEVYEEIHWEPVWPFDWLVNAESQCGLCTEMWDEGMRWEPV